MMFSRANVRPCSVAEAIGDSNLEGKIVGVHGVLYYGKGCRPGEYLCYEKSGPFDGLGPIPMPGALDRGKCLLVEQAQLEDRLAGWLAAGDFLIKWDSIIVGTIRRAPGTEHPVRITDLVLLFIQDCMDVGRGKQSISASIICFPEALPTNQPGRNVASRLGLPAFDIVPSSDGIAKNDVQ